MTFNMITNNVMERLYHRYNYAYRDNIFSDEEINEIVNTFTNKTEDATVVLDTINNSVVDDNVRRSKTHFISPTQENSWIFTRINQAVYELNELFFNYDLSGYGSIQYTEYKASEQGFYDWHMDASFQEHRTIDELNMALRKLSFIIFLDQHGVDFEGGTFLINNSTESKASEPSSVNKGTIIVFPSFLIHKVTPVTKGTRRTLVGWVIGPKFK